MQCVSSGTWAEYAAVREEFLAPAPSKLSLSEAAGAVPLVALTAFQVACPGLETASHACETCTQVRLSYPGVPQSPSQLNTEECRLWRTHSPRLENEYSSMQALGVSAAGLYSWPRSTTGAMSLQLQAPRIRHSCGRYAGSPASVTSSLACSASTRNPGPAHSCSHYRPRPSSTCTYWLVQ